MKQITLTIISVLLICSSIFANDNISDNSSLHVFNSGDTISSSMMNDNFELLKLSNLDLMNQIKYLNDNISASNVKIEELQNLINKLIKYNNLDSDEINYIAVCEQGNILTSIDGISWKVKNIGSSLNITGISKGNGVYVAIGRGDQDYNESKIFVSSDTHTWMTITPPTTESLDSITFGKEMFITVGSRGIFTSLDGYSWNQVTSPTSRKIEHIEFGDNIFFTGGVKENPTTYMKSSDGLNWEQLIFPENKQVNNIRYVNGYFYVVGDEQLMRSK